MYIPHNMKMRSITDMHQFIGDYSFGVIVSDRLDGTHVPFLLDSNKGEKGTLYFHLAKATPHWRKLDGQTVLVIFMGPHSYISPSWYEKGPGVPTWNYVAVHVYGKVSLLDGSQILNVIEKTVAKYEPSLLNKKEILAPEYVGKLSQAIVGFEIELTELQGKLKLGQQRTNEDQKGVLAALSQSTGTDEQALVQFMQKHSIGVGE